jgi:hypothetical protein
MEHPTGTRLALALLVAEAPGEEAAPLREALRDLRPRVTPRWAQRIDAALDAGGE